MKRRIWHEWHARFLEVQQQRYGKVYSMQCLIYALLLRIVYNADLEEFVC